MNVYMTEPRCIVSGKFNGVITVLQHSKRQHHLAFCIKLRTIKGLIDLQFIRISTQYNYNMGLW